MSNAREMVDSIVHFAGKLQNFTDEQIEDAFDELDHIDDLLDEVVDMIENPEE